MATISLLGFGQDTMVSPIDAFLLQHPKPTSTDVSNFLRAFSGPERTQVAQELIARGVSSNTVAAALNWLDTAGSIMSKKATILGVLALLSASASAYHGYKRNQSVPWALWWFFMGSLFPVVTPVIGLAQGFGKPRKVS